MSNNIAVDGKKYVVNNLAIGFDDLCTHCHGLGGFADPDEVDEFESERASGIHVEGNIFEKSHVLIGGSGTPAEQNVVTNNRFADSELQLGLASPTQTIVTNNVIAWSYLDSRYLWIDNDPAYGSPPQDNVRRSPFASLVRL